MENNVKEPVEMEYIKESVEIETFKDILIECLELYKKKNNDYGNSFDKGCEVIGPAYAVGRIYDKCNRLIELSKPDKIARVDESLEDTLKDMANYCIMYISYIRRTDEQ